MSLSEYVRFRVGHKWIFTCNACDEVVEDYLELTEDTRVGCPIKPIGWTSLGGKLYCPKHTVWVVVDEPVDDPFNAPDAIDFNDPKTGPAEIFDANGLQYKRVTRCNPVTGDIEWLPDGTTMRQHRVAAPLTIKFANP